MTGMTLFLGLKLSSSGIEFLDSLATEELREIEDRLLSHAERDFNFIGFQ